MACCVNPVQGKNKIGSIGMPLPDVDVRIVDAEDAAQRDADRRSRRADPARAAAHARVLEQPGRDGRDARTLRRRAARGCTRATSPTWTHDGYIFLVDRKKDMMKTSGFQVWPREIEEVIAAHPAVHRSGRRWRSGRRQGRGRQGVGRAEGRSDRRPRTSCGPTAASGSRRTRCRRASNSGRSCPKTMVGKVLRRVLAAESSRATAP